MKLILLFLLFQSSSALAAIPDWLSQYLKSNSIKCTFTEDIIRVQVTAHLERNVQQISDTLKEKGSEFQTITKEPDFEIGMVPKPSIFDFYVLDGVTVVVHGFKFPVQTTYTLNENSAPAVVMGLWFPVKIKDSGRDKPCLLERTSLTEDQRKLAPQVNLVFGIPPRVVATDLAQVVDISNAPPPPQQPPPPPAPAPAPVAVSPEAKKNEPAPPPVRQKDSEEESSDRAERRRERRRERRAERRRERKHRREQEKEERRHKRRHLSSQNEEEQQRSSQPPEKPDECSGDVSPWKSALCKVTGKK